MNMFRNSLLCLGLLSSVVHAEPFTLSDAEQGALQADPVIQRWQNQQAQFNARAEGALSYPNPVLSVGLQNLPTDSFSMDQEAMTQLRFGYKQMLPRGDSLQIKQQLFEQSGALSPLQQQLRQRQLLQQLRVRWVNWLYWSQQQQLLQQQQSLWQQLIQFTQSLYSVGRQNQQDVLAVRLQQQQIQQSIFQAEQNKAVQRAQLLEWLPDVVPDVVLSQQVPAWPQPDWSALQQAVLQHPSVLILQQQATLKQTEVALAKTDYQPSWTVDVGYGMRFGDNPNGDTRADFVSATVAIDLPWFDKRRPDANVKAALLAKDEVRFQLQQTQQQLQAALMSAQQQYQGLVQQLQQLQQQLLPLAQQQREATLLAYETDVSSFAQVILAYNQELTLQQQALKLQADLWRIQIDLNSLLGE